MECTSCHGKGTHLSHGHVSDLVNHTWRLYGTHYPYNQTAAEEPVVCSTCHTQSWATSQLGVIQSLTTELITNVTQAIENAKTSIDVANQTSGANQTKIALATDMVETAEDYIDDVERDSSEGFHNPEKTTAMLGQAAHLANGAQSLAFEALASEATTLEAQVASLENQTSTLQTDIENLQDRIDSLESTAATVPYLYAGLGLAIGFIVGVAILYAVVWRRKP